MSSRLAPQFSDTDTARRPEKREGDFCPPHLRFEVLGSSCVQFAKAAEDVPVRSLDSKWLVRESAQPTLRDDDQCGA